MSSDTDDSDDTGYEDDDNGAECGDDWTDGIAEFLGDDPDEL